MTMGVAYHSSAHAVSFADAVTLAPGQLERLSVQYALSRDPRLRELLILHHQRLVRSLAARFIGLGETLEDLIQVGNIGLINALDRFNPRQGTRFSTYATPTILGEIRRYFRDKAPALRLPRWVAEVQRAARRASTELVQELGRQPSTAEIAQRIGEPEDRVLAAMESQDSAHVLSLDAAMESNGSDASALGELIGRHDRTLCEFERFGDLREALLRLNERERQVIALRFFDDMSQSCIAQRLNLSQMHVSRLQQRALCHLRALLAESN
jgi:RNA polymerase sigma-B factor